MDDAVLWWMNYAYGRGYHIETKNDMDTLDEVERAHNIEGCPCPEQVPITRAAYKDQMRAGQRAARFREAP